eukprot:7743778-Karenia_brevis.AAC.1
MAIIPLTDLSNHTVCIFRNYLKSRFGKWAAVPILDCATYLGFDVVPKAALTVWSKALAGWQKTAQMICEADMT